MNTPLGKSPQLRQAFELSLDRNLINKAVYNGLNQPDCSPLPLKSPYRPDRRDLLGPRRRRRPRRSSPSRA